MQIRCGKEWLVRLKFVFFFDKIADLRFDCQKRPFCFDEFYIIILNVFVERNHNFYVQFEILIGKEKVHPDKKYDRQHIVKILFVHVRSCH